MQSSIAPSRADAAQFDPETEIDFDRAWGETDQPSWAESVVTATVATFTVLFVSSVAVLMYLA